MEASPHCDKHQCRHLPTVVMEDKLEDTFEDTPEEEHKDEPKNEPLFCFNGIEPLFCFNGIPPLHVSPDYSTWHSWHDAMGCDAEAWLMWHHSQCCYYQQLSHSLQMQLTLRWPAPPPPLAVMESQSHSSGPTTTACTPRTRPLNNVKQLVNKKVRPAVWLDNGLQAKVANKVANNKDSY